MKRIFIGDTEMEGVASAVIALTKRGMDFSDLSRRTFDYTNTFKAPSTPVNDALFGNAKNYRSRTSFPYMLQDVKLIDDGIEVISFGRAYLQRASGGGYEMFIVSGGKGFFDDLAGKKLWDLSGLKYPYHLSALVGPAAYRSSASGLVCPVCYAGKDPAGTDVPTSLAFIYYKDVMDRIFTDAGYKKKGDVFADSKYLNMVVGANGSVNGYEPRFSSDRAVKVYVAANQNINAGAGQYVNFTGIQNAGTSPKGYWDGTSKYLGSDADITAGEIMFDVNVVLSLTLTVPVGSTVKVMLRNAATDIDTIATVVGTGSAQVVNYDFNTANYLSGGGWAISPAYARNGAGDVSIQVDRVSGLNPVPVTVTAGTLEITPFLRPSLGSSLLAIQTWGYYAQLLPDMNQSEFLRDFMVRFGLVARENSKGEIEFTRIETAINTQVNAVDMTGKRVNEIDDVNFTPLSYAQKNLFTYAKNDNAADATVSDGYFTIDSEVIAAEATVYASPWSKTASRIYNGINCAYVPVFTNEAYKLPTIRNEDGGPRLLLVRDRYSFEPATYPGGAFAGYKVAYFEDAMQASSMKFQQSVDQCYPSLVNALQKAKLVKRYYYMTAIDFVRINPASTLFDTDAHWAIAEVSSFVSGKPTAVQILKL